MSNPLIVYKTNHGIPIGSKCTFTSTGVLPYPITETVEYYIITEGYTANSFEISLDEEGTPIATSGFYSGVITIHNVVSSPVVGLDWSNDGGHTWSNRYFKSIGRIGEYAFRTIWRRLGKSRTRIFRATITEPVKVVLLDAFAEIEGLK
ncbi:hypothetical protein M0R04_09505 [Candidatus Dojkabacteria bacterium]|jgi:hypothetical protein|nr:hypothetical protein [Candidatus Dojkabacteria bacterium]